MKRYQSNQSMLRKALRANALFSVLSGVLLMIAAAPLAELMFVPQLELLGFGMTTVLVAAGIGILIFGIDVALISRPERLNLMQTRLVLTLDVLWVIASAALLVFLPDVFTTWGTAIVIVIAIAVADLGLMEFIGLAMVHEGESQTTAVYDGNHLTITASLETDISADRVWSIMRQQERYADVADNLSFVKILEGTGTGMIRECADTKGRSWQETCTRWVEGEGFGFRVHTDAPDYPYPIAALAGDWSVAETQAGSRMKMVFKAEAKSGLLNWLAFRLMAVPFAPLCDRLLLKWVEMMRAEQMATSEARIPAGTTLQVS
jgi:hypothetical protein